MLGGDHLNENGWPQMYGLGWFLETYFGHRVVHHGGTSTGTIGQVLFMPDDNFGVVVFTNTVHDFPEELARYIVGLFVGGQGAP
jgi:CubicO group peptidase (beta-lactamase class C family)